MKIIEGLKARTCTLSKGGGPCAKMMMGPKFHRAQLCFLSDVKQFKLLGSFLVWLHLLYAKSVSNKALTLVAKTEEPQKSSG